MIPSEYSPLLQLISPDLINSTLNSLLPQLTIALKPERFFQTPQDFRNFLPVVRDRGNIHQNDLLLEWECGNLDSHGYPEGIAGLFCTGSSPVSDSTHFSGEFFIEEDGIASFAPYFVIKNPDFSGLLHLNPGKINDTIEDSLKPANLRSLNAVFSYIATTIIKAAGY